MRSKAFFINGGAGRVICSIPALEKYTEENPDDDFVIICEGGTDFYKGHPTLDGRAYDVWHKNVFEHHIKDRQCVTLEPYRVWDYYNQKCSLTQAFDIQINNLEEPREVSKPTLNLSKMEVIAGYNVVQEVKSVTGNDKVLVIQPFGRGVEQLGDFVADGSSRSLSLVNIVDIINQLKKDYAVIVMSEIHFPVEENEEKSKYKIARPQIQDMRHWAAVIDVADHFLGCDSMGQHLVKALDGTATVVVGSTFPVNISYPNDKDFDVIDIGDGRRKYSPIRISQEEHIERFNDQSMEMDKSQIKQVVDSVRKRLGKPTKFTGTYVPIQQEQQACCDNPKHDHVSGATAAAYAGAQNTSQSAYQGTGRIKPQAPTPNFTLEPAKPPKVNKGFAQEVKSLLKSDKPSIKIEKKSEA